MLWMKQAATVDCIRIGGTVMATSALSIGLRCAPYVPPPVPATPTSPQVASVQTKPPDLLPAVKPVEVPLEPPPPPVDCAVEACLALTFDDGPDPHTTPQLLDILSEQNVRATFFMIGSHVAKYPDIVQRVEREGHEIGNHSWGHGNFTKMPPEQMKEDIEMTQKAFKGAGVKKLPRLFRPPYGARNDTVRQVVPFSLVLWNIDPEDWRTKDPNEAAARVITSAKPGGIIVMHDTKPITVAAAPEFIANLKQTYRLVTVSQLLSLTPETPKNQFFGR